MWHGLKFFLVFINNIYIVLKTCRSLAIVTVINPLEIFHNFFENIAEWNKRKCIGYFSVIIILHPEKLSVFLSKWKIMDSRSFGLFHLYFVWLMLQHQYAQTLGNGVFVICNSKWVFSWRLFYQQPRDFIYGTVSKITDEDKTVWFASVKNSYLLSVVMEFPMGTELR